MSCKPDIKTTHEMYELYQQGFSLAQTGKAFGVTRQSVYERFKRRSLQLRTVKPVPFVMFKGDKYSLKPSGYYQKTTGDRQFLHRAVWEFDHGKIPPKHDIHHVDHDRGNNSPENLELYTKSEHASKFNTGHNQYTEKRA